MTNHHLLEREAIAAAAIAATIKENGAEPLQYRPSTWNPNDFS
jgi:hypothetical protein